MSQAYPLGFGAAHALAFVEWGGVVEPVPAPGILDVSNPWFFRDFVDRSWKWDNHIREEHKVALSAGSKRAARSRSR